MARYFILYFGKFTALSRSKGLPGGVDEGGGFENRCAARHRGAQSLPLRQPENVSFAAAALHIWPTNAILVML